MIKTWQEQCGNAFTAHPDNFVCRQMQAEIDELRAENESLTRCISDFEGTTRENIELRAELAALKNQPHIARATGKSSGDYSEVARVYETPFIAGVALYLAPGAQPVPEINFFDAQRIANDYGLEYNKFCAAYKAMLEAAKETK